MLHIINSATGNTFQSVFNQNKAKSFKKNLLQNIVYKMSPIFPRPHPCDNWRMSSLHVDTCPDMLITNRYDDAIKLKHFPQWLALWAGDSPVTLLSLSCNTAAPVERTHDDVIKWEHFPRYWHLVRVIHQPSLNSPHKGQWRKALVFSLICAWKKAA